MLLTFAETTAETIMIIAKTDIKGITVVPFVTVLGKNFFTTNPKIIGMIMTCTIERNIDIAFTGIHCPASNNKIRGVAMGASNVDNDVIVIDNAKFPFAK